MKMNHLPRHIGANLVLWKKKAFYNVFMGSNSILRQFWILPVGCVLLLLLLVHFTLFLDHTLNLKHSHWLWPIQSLNGAHNLVYTVAAAMYTFVASTFTISIAALSFASRDMGPRLLENFVQDWKTQLTLGILLGTFSFNLWTIAVVQSTPQSNPVPLLTVNVAVLLAYLALGMLIMFIYQMTRAMNITSQVNHLGRQLQQTLLEVSSVLPALPQPEPLKDAILIHSTHSSNLCHIKFRPWSERQHN
ncbi:hypothetical protein GCM10008938_19290 [Deinococcus roseus]|uniref:DUF2254 domain-containing protein n=1 Tax=Deinococcus roseus TaxID=392414 RepID=A0ABQ2CYG4_9DEIO|nr:hypothetical protein GCM10008938_19290 [Deinococcus roseus]